MITTIGLDHQEWLGDSIEAIPLAEAVGETKTVPRELYELAQIFFQQAATGFVDRATTLTAAPTVQVDHAPRYRV